ncbi:MAG: PIN domain-containing protein [Chloroflexota bacterium]
MRLTSATAIFIDASCLITAANSPTAGSGFWLSVGRRGFFRALVSISVFTEAQRKVQSKLPAALDRLHALIAETPLEIVATPPDRLIQAYAAAFADDAHVVAAAVESHAKHLITLDRALEAKVNAADFPLTA